MNASLSAGISLQSLRMLDNLCGEFESQLTAGQEPAIADYLKKQAFSKIERAYLFRELARIQWELRPAQQDSLQCSWEQLFPDYRSLLPGQPAAAPAATPSLQAADFSTTLDLVNRKQQGSGTTNVSLAYESDRYQVIRQHAHGGLGEVLVARDESLGRSVALKRIRRGKSQDPGTRARFLREAAITAALQHPGIVPVYGVGQSADGEPFYSMRFVEGRNLGACIREFHNRAFNKPLAQTLEFRQLLQRMISVCDTVHYAHDRGVIHRDLKPANIMIGDYGETLVVDWGLAKLIGEAGSSDSQTAVVRDSGRELTEQGAVVGTRAYMAPEQAAGKEVRAGADIFSLGATLYHVLTGRPPLPGGQISAARDVPAPLLSICRKACAIQSADRYETAAGIARELERWLANEPVAAHRETWRERTGRLGRRHRAWVQAGSVALVLLLVVVSVALVQVTLARNDAVKLADEKGKLAEANGKLAEEKGKLASDKQTLLTKTENLLGERTKLLTETKTLAEEKGKLADHNGVLAVGQLQAREQAEQQAISALYQLALGTEDSLAARHLLVSGIDQIETARRDATQLAADDPLLPFSPGHEKFLNDWDRSYRLQLAAIHQAAPFLEAVGDAGLLQPGAIMYSPDERSAQFYQAVMPVNPTPQTVQLLGSADAGLLPQFYTNQLYAGLTAEAKYRTSQNQMNSVPFGKGLKLEPQAKFLGRSSDFSHFVVQLADKSITVREGVEADQATTITVPSGEEWIGAGYSAKASRLVLGSKAGKLFVIDQKVQKLDGENQKPPRERKISASAVSYALLSADGEWVAALSSEGVSLWNLRDDRFQLVPCPWRNQGLFTFLPGDQMLAMSTVTPGSIRLMHVQTGEVVPEPLAALGEVTTIHPSPSGDHLAITQLPPGFSMTGLTQPLPPGKAGHVCVALFWNCRAIRPASPEVTRNHNYTYLFSMGGGPASRFHPRLPLLATVRRNLRTRSYNLCLVNFEQHPAVVEELECPAAVTELLGFTPDGKECFALAADKHVYFWNVETNERTRAFDCSQLRFDNVRNWFSPAGDKMVYAAGLTELTFTDLPSGKSETLSMNAAKPGGGFITGVTVATAFSPSGKYFLSGARNGNIHVWDGQTGAKAADEIPGRDVINLRLQWSPREDRVLAFPILSPPRLIEFPSGREIATLTHTATTHLVATDSSGDRFAVATLDGEVNCYSWATGERVAPTIRLPKSAWRIAFADEGRVLITEFNGVQQWDLSTGRKLGRTIHGKLIAVSPDGKHLAIERADASLDLVTAATQAQGTAAELRLILQAATGTEWTKHSTLAPLNARQLLKVHEQAQAAKANLALIPLPQQLLPAKTP